MEGETDSLSLIQLLVLVTNTSVALLWADVAQKPTETKKQAAQLDMSDTQSHQQLGVGNERKAVGKEAVWLQTINI